MNNDWCDRCLKKKISIIIDSFSICNDCILLDVAKYHKIENMINKYLDPCSKQEMNIVILLDDIKKII